MSRQDAGVVMVPRAEGGGPLPPRRHRHTHTRSPRFVLTTGTVLVGRPAPAGVAA